MDLQLHQETEQGFPWSTLSPANPLTYYFFQHWLMQLTLIMQKLSVPLRENVVYVGRRFN